MQLSLNQIEPSLLKGVRWGASKVSRPPTPKTISVERPFPGEARPRNWRLEPQTTDPLAFSVSPTTQHRPIAGTLCDGGFLFHDLGLRAHDRPQRMGP